MSKIFTILRFVVLVAAAAVIALACEADYLIWMPRSSSAQPLYRFIRHNKAGYIDSEGRVVIPPRFTPLGNYASEFHDGLLEIGVSGGKYVTRNGERAFNKKLYRGWDFSEGLAVAMKDDGGLWGYIDTKGEFAISPRFKSSQSDYVWSFSDGVAKIKVNGRFGFIDHSGKFVIKPDLLDATDFHEGLARIVAESPCLYFPDGMCGSVNPVLVGASLDSQAADCKFAYIDKSGRIITKSRFDGARDFSEGLAPVRVGKLWGFIDKTGEIVITPRFEDAGSFHSGLCQIRVKGLFGYADRSGRIVLPAQYSVAEDFSDGLAAVGDGKRFWYIDTRGEQAIPRKFALASSFFKGLADVKLLHSSTFAYIDRKGRTVFRY